MIEFYPQIKWVHVSAALTSGGLFLLRWSAVQAGYNRVAMAAPVRYLSYSVDTVLLTAALMLSTILHQYPFVHAWLTVKILLIVVYIVLGSFALKRAGTRRARATFGVAALCTFGLIYSIARAHHPLGLFARWFA